MLRASTAHCSDYRDADADAAGYLDLRLHSSELLFC
jgi:hypothetical protein